MALLPPHQIGLFQVTVNTNFDLRNTISSTEIGFHINIDEVMSLWMKFDSNLTIRMALEQTYRMCLATFLKKKIETHGPAVKKTWLCHHV